VTETTTISEQSSVVSPPPTGVVPDPPIKLASGLGNRVDLLIADIHYDGGILQITDG
jgi:hypothetical protein